MDTAQPKKPTPAPIDPEAARRADRKALLRLRRSYDEGEEVAFLNITAMMDMMTILLVFMLQSMAASSANVTVSDQLALPNSDTSSKIEESVAVTLTRSAVLVEGSPVVSVKRGVIDASEKLGGDANELIIRRLLDSLKNRAVYAKAIAERKKKRFEGALTIIADKTTPYRLLTEVMYTAGKAEYRKYRLIVLKK